MANDLTECLHGQALQKPGTRRMFMGGVVAVASLTVLGCGRSPPDEPLSDQPSNVARPEAATQSIMMTVYRDPSCGCCKAWAEIARKAGYQVTLVDRPDMPAIKQKFGVPEALASCHTAIIGGYAVEGHVPMEDVARLLKERPSGIEGVAVAGMPRGSPGMEMPDGSKDPFQVMAFDATGQTSVYRG